MYPWLLFGHLLGVVLLVAGWAIYVAAIEGCRRAPTVAQLRTLSGLTLAGERVLAAGGPLLIGFGLALVARFYDFSQPWVIAALALVVVQGLLGAAVVGPRAHQLHTTLTIAPDGPLTDDLAARARDRVLHVANRTSIPVLLDIEFLMTLKPEVSDIILSLVVVAVLALALCRPVVGDRPRPSPTLPTTPGA